MTVTKTRRNLRIAVGIAAFAGWSSRTLAGVAFPYPHIIAWVYDPRSGIKNGWVMELESHYGVSPTRWERFKEWWSK